MTDMVDDCLPPTTPPRRPALRYFGGKWRLAPWIVDLLPRHYRYCEPFGGGASVLLHKAPSPIEIYNDVNQAVVRFFRVLRTRPSELIEALKLTPYAADEYATAREPCEDDIEAARRLFVRSWMGFHSMGTATRGFRRCADRPMGRSFADVVDGLGVVAHRLRKVVIENMPYERVLEFYDGPDTCFYVDPPYMMSTRRRPEDGYGEHELTDEQHEELCRRLQHLRGTVIVSGYPSHEYDRWLKGFVRRSKVACGNEEVLWIKDEKPRQATLFV